MTIISLFPSWYEKVVVFFDEDDDDLDLVDESDDDGDDGGEAKEAVDEIATNLQSTATDAQQRLNNTTNEVEDHFAHTNNNHHTTV